jgi:hypothetical protein
MLHIKNPDDIKGMNFVDGRFTLRGVETYYAKYRFAFKETSRWVYVDVYREPKWDSEQNVNIYRVDNGKFGNNHWISAKWFGMIKNVKFTFNSALKEL